jgi:hypothetical protein
MQKQSLGKTREWLLLPGLSMCVPGMGTDLEVKVLS